MFLIYEPIVVGIVGFTFGWMVSSSIRYRKDIIDSEVSLPDWPQPWDYEKDEDELAPPAQIQSTYAWKDLEKTMSEINKAANEIYDKHRAFFASIEQVGAPKTPPETAPFEIWGIPAVCVDDFLKKKTYSDNSLMFKRHQREGGVEHVSLGPYKNDEITNSL